MRKKEVFWAYFAPGDPHPMNPHMLSPIHLWCAFDEGDRPIGAFYRGQGDNWVLFWHPGNLQKILDAMLTVEECKQQFLKWRLR